MPSRCRLPMEYHTPQFLRRLICHSHGHECACVFVDGIFFCQLPEKPRVLRMVGSKYVNNWIGLECTGCRYDMNLSLSLFCLFHLHNVSIGKQVCCFPIKLNGNDTLSYDIWFWYLSQRNKTLKKKNVIVKMLFVKCFNVRHRQFK